MKDITKNEIANIIHVLAYLAKIDKVVDPAEKKTFKIVCERFGIKIPDLYEILKEKKLLYYQKNISQTFKNYSWQSYCKSMFNFIDGIKKGE